MANLLLNWKCLRTLPFLSRLFDASSVSFTSIFISISFQVVIAWCSVHTTPHHTYSSYYFIIMLHEKIHVFLVSCTNYKYANKIIFFWEARQCKSKKFQHNWCRESKMHKWIFYAKVMVINGNNYFDTVHQMNAHVDTFLYSQRMCNVLKRMITVF